MGTPPQELAIALPEDGCAYCCVFYGCKSEYLVLTLVLARRIAIYGDKHPLIILPTPDVPVLFLDTLRRAGCQVYPPVDYLWMHPVLLRSPEGRHRCVLTKLQALGLTGLRKVLLVDADILPRKRLDALLQFRAPAAMLMPANLPYAEPLSPGKPVPDAWFDVCSETGVGARVNAGICLLEPDPQLLEYIANEVDPTRDLVEAFPVSDVFGGSWRPSWTPEEDALTRGLRVFRPGAAWTHVGAACNFEVQGDLEYYPGMPLAEEHARLDLAEEVSIFHYSGSRKPSWYAWHIGRGEMNVDEVCWHLRDHYAEEDPRGINATATREWLEAFQELCSHARTGWGLDLLGLLGWAAPELNARPSADLSEDLEVAWWALSPKTTSPEWRERSRSRSDTERAAGGARGVRVLKAGAS